MDLRKIEIEEYSGKIFKMIGSDWMLITAGTRDSWNTMTASWGGFGVLWHKNVSFCFVRESRFTYEFMNSHEEYTLSFFDESKRDALDYCGSHSGRDVDKAAETGLTPASVDGSVSFDQARLIIVCKKLYFQDFDPANFVDPQLHSNYSEKDYHRMYVGEITACYTR
jgi:flavin reductase (DIM6/NTAB) family NADH-FMN oxidoreductase RutF